LNRTDGEKRKNFEIDPAAKCGSEGALCGPECERASACVGGFVGGTNQEMRKGRYASRKAKLRAGEIRLKVHVSALERVGSSTEIRGESKRTKNLECATGFPTVEVEVLRVGSVGAASRRAKDGLGEADGSARKRVSAKKLDALRV